MLPFKPWESIFGAAFHKMRRKVLSVFLVALRKSPFLTQYSAGYSVFRKHGVEIFSFDPWKRSGTSETYCSKDGMKCIEVLFLSFEEAAVFR